MRAALFLSAAVALSGCVTPQVFAKNGVTYDRYERDATECVTKAIQAVPPNIVSAYDTLGGLYTADTHAQARATNTQLCMRDKGYQLISVPLCTGEALKNARKRAGTEAARSEVIQVGPQSCVVPISGTDLSYFWKTSAQ
jgi:hypothetical protein